MSWDLFSILLPAFAAGLIVIGSHVVLGRQVLRRGIVFIDLAIAQVAALGVVVSHSVPGLTDGGLSRLLPMGFSVVVALLIAGCSKRWPRELEAIIGCLYVVAAAVVLLVLANDPHGAEMITHSLSGSILWLMYGDLILPFGITLLFIAAVLFFPVFLDSRLFYPVFAVMVTLSVDLVGVYLVFSTLIMPALAASRIKDRKHALLMAFFMAAASYVVGLMLSGLFDVPGGATIVVILAITCSIGFIGCSGFSARQQSLTKVHSSAV